MGHRLHRIMGREHVIMGFFLFVVFKRRRSCARARGGGAGRREEGF